MTILKDQYARGLRELADFVEKCELDDRIFVNEKRFFVFCSSVEEFGRNVKNLGPCRKSASSGYLNASRSFGGNIVFEVTVAQDVACERVKTGEITIDAQEERFIPAEPERVEDIYEWQCPTSFLALGKEEAAKVGEDL